MGGKVGDFADVVAHVKFRVSWHPGTLLKAQPHNKLKIKIYSQFI